MVRWGNEEPRLERYLEVSSSEYDFLIELFTKGLPEFAQQGVVQDPRGSNQLYLAINNIALPMIVRKGGYQFAEGD